VGNRERDHFISLQYLQIIIISLIELQSRSQLGNLCEKHLLLLRPVVLLFRELREHRLRANENLRELLVTAVSVISVTIVNLR